MQSFVVLAWSAATKQVVRTLTPPFGRYGMHPRLNLFISHISEEAELAATLKSHVMRDFLGMVDVFASSDTESISAGEEWLNAIKVALHRANIEIVLCSHDSVYQPWVNFEAAVGWTRSIPVIPACHSGLLPAALPMPLAALQGVAAGTQEGLQRVYRRIAELLELPAAPNVGVALVEAIKSFEIGYSPLLRRSAAEARRDAAAWARMLEDLQDPTFRWRTVKRLADRAGGLNEDAAADLLRQRPEILFGRSDQTGELIARLRVIDKVVR